MVTGREVVDTARTYLGTPFHHQGRLKGVGIDCIGLIACTAKDLGLPFVDCTNYSRITNGRTLTEKAAESPLDLIPLDQARTGDVMLFWIANSDHPQHAAFWDGESHSIIHTYTGARQVIEAPFTHQWRQRLAAVYRWREVE